MDEKQRLIDEVSARLNAMHEGCTVKVTEVKKNNGITLTGIALKMAGSAIAATVYLNDYLEEIEDGRMDILYAAELLVQTLSQHQMREDIVDAVKEFVENPQKELIRAQVINAERNKELLSHTPHQVIGEDLAVVARYQICPEGNILIDENLAVKLGMTPTEIIEAGSQNVKKEKYEIITMGNMLTNLMGGCDDMLRDEMESQISVAAPMLIVTNQSRVNGAAGIFMDTELRKDVYDRLGGDFYILPASIHETIVVPAEQFRIKEINEMIQEVNATQLPEEEVLSDHLYYVDASLRIKPIFDEKETEKDIEKSVAKASTGQHM